MRDLSAFWIPGQQGSVNDESQWLSMPDSKTEMLTHTLVFWEKWIFMGHGILLPCCVLQSCDRNDPAPFWHMVWIQSAAQILLLPVLLPQALKADARMKPKSCSACVSWLLQLLSPVRMDPSRRYVQPCSPGSTTFAGIPPLLPAIRKKRAWSVIRYLNRLHIACPSEAGLELDSGVDTHVPRLGKLPAPYRTCSPNPLSV